jgi:hypothetical protein
LQSAVSSNSVITAEVKTEPVESDHQKQEMKVEEDEVSDEDVELKSTQKPSPSLFTITKSTEQVLSIGDICKDTNTR